MEIIKTVILDIDLVFSVCYSWFLVITGQLLKENLLMKEAWEAEYPDQGHIATKCIVFARLPDPWGLFFIYFLL